MATTVASIKAELDLDDSKFKSKMSGASKDVDGLAGSFKSAELASKAFAVAIVGLAVGIVALGVKSVEAFSQQEDAIAALNHGLETNKENVVAASKALQDQASALQQVTKFSDEAIISADASFTIYGLSAGAIEKLNPALLDMAEGIRDVDGKTIGLNAAAKLMGRVLGNAEGGIEGMTTALARQGIMLSEEQQALFKTGTEAERVTALVDILNEAVGGRAEAAGKTFSGQMAIMKNNVNEFQESLGQMIVVGLQPVIKGFHDWFESMGGAEGLMNRLNNEIFPALKQNIPLIAGLLAGILAPAIWAVVAPLAVSMIHLLPFIAAGVALGAVVQLLVNAFGGWGNVMLTLQPMIDAVGMVFRDLILPQLQLLWNEIQTNLLPALTLLWQELGPILMPILQALAGFLGLALLGAIVGIITVIRLLVSVITMWVENVNWAVKTIKELFSSIPGSISASLSSVFDIITSPFRRAFDDIKRMAQDMMNSVKNALNMEKRHSPSVIDIVKRGVGLVNIELAKVGDITIPTLSEGLTGGGTGGVSNSTNSSNSVQIYVDHVGDMSDVQAIGRELGFKLSLMPH